MGSSCATDVGRSHRAARLLPQSFVWRLAAESAVRPVEIVEVLPLAEALVEDAGVVDHDAIEHPVELLGVDTVGAFDLAVQPRGGGPDVDVADAAVKHVVVEG